jgi:hypothetical protein
VAALGEHLDTALSDLLLEIAFLLSERVAFADEFSSFLFVLSGRSDLSRVGDIESVRLLIERVDAGP